MTSKLGASPVSLLQEIIGSVVLYRACGRKLRDTLVDADGGGDGATTLLEGARRQRSLPYLPIDSAALPNQHNQGVRKTLVDADDGRVGGLDRHPQAVPDVSAALLLSQPP